jgi:hypothetical protein
MGTTLKNLASTLLGILHFSVVVHFRIGIVTRNDPTYEVSREKSDSTPSEPSGLVPAAHARRKGPSA